MGRLKKRRKFQKKSPEKKKALSVIIGKKSPEQDRQKTVSKTTHRHINILPGIFILSAAAILVSVWLLIQNYPMVVTQARTAVTALFVNANMTMLVGIGVAALILVLAFFLPAKRKKLVITSQKLKSQKVSSHHFGSGWRDFASKHLSESAKSNPEARMLFRKKSKRPFQITIQAYETGLDALYHEIQKRGKVTLEEIQMTFKISKELAEEWAHILEAKLLIQIEYPPFGSMLLTMPKKTEEQ